MPLVNVRSLRKIYPMEHGSVEVLRGVSLMIERGESLAIMGPSGSGKSTLLHLLGCLDTPTEGQYFLDGREISTRSDEELAEIRASQIGFVFQSFNLIPQLNLFENVALPFLYRKPSLPFSVKREKTLEAIERVGLSHRLSHLPSQLSGGETQRAAIARALVIDPLLILADEPTGNLDRQTGKTILKLFQDLNMQGVTLVMITHDEAVGATCRCILRMQDGLLRQPDV